MDKLMIFGASGLLGANLVAETQTLPFERIGVSFRNQIQLAGLRSLQLDLRDPIAAEHSLASTTPRIVMYCAAATQVDWCEDHSEEAELLNAFVPARLAGHCRSSGARFVYISTDSVFDGTRGWYTEADEVHPLNAYASSKAHGERLILKANPDSLIIRTTIHGWNAQSKLSLSEWILEELRQRRTITGFEDAVFTPILVNDLAPILFRLIEEGTSGVFHVGSSDGCTKLAFAQQLAEIYRLDPTLIRPARLADAAFKARRPLDVSLSSAKAIQLLGRDRWPTVRSGLLRFKALDESGLPTFLKRLFPTGGPRARHLLR